MPEWVEQWRRTSLRGIPIASCQRLDEQSDRTIATVAEAAHARWGSGVPADQAVAPPSCSILTGTELPQARKGPVSTHVGVLQLCPPLCDPVDCGLLGFSIQGIFQARMLEWVAIPF